MADTKSTNQEILIMYQFYDDNKKIPIKRKMSQKKALEIVMNNMKGINDRRVLVCLKGGKDK